MQDALTRILILFTWIGAGLGLAFIGNSYLDLPEALYFISIVLALGSFCYFHRPFYQLQMPTAIDFGITVISGLIVFIYLTSLVVGPSLEQEKSFETCGTQAKERKCYSIPKTVCLTMWKKYEDECVYEIKKEAAENATAYVSSGTKKCIQSRYDKSLYYTRKSEEPGCQDFFQLLKE